MLAGFSRYSLQRLENRLMVAPSMTRWSADQLTFMIQVTGLCQGVLVCGCGLVVVLVCGCGLVVVLGEGPPAQLVGPQLAGGPERLQAGQLLGDVEHAKLLDVLQVGDQQTLSRVHGQADVMRRLRNRTTRSRLGLEGFC
ncbi:hypothetical protein EYF80_053222 [Liparis tanakae]|uniref:Uncharacterized protein n=1 Tax=Liparis tanakae TaxID=230148 RepID=A0A4Z2F731_9TELE|nr:hypothetical protein EYF80_053222 [Liparis tanakae]